MQRPADTEFIYIFHTTRKGAKSGLGTWLVSASGIVAPTWTVPWATVHTKFAVTDSEILAGTITIAYELLKKGYQQTILTKTIVLCPYE